MEALRSYQESLGVFRKLAEADPNSAQPQRDLSVSVSKLGDVQLQQGESAAALASYQEALGISRRLSAVDPSSVQARRDLSLSLIKLGDVQLEQGGREAALASYEEALRVRRRLAEADPSSAVAQRDLAVALIKLGDVQFEPKQGDLVMGDGNSNVVLVGEALWGLEEWGYFKSVSSYEESLRVVRRLAEADPSSSTAQRDLTVALIKQGDVHLNQRSYRAAMTSFQRALEVARNLAEADQLSAVAQRDLSDSLERIGDVQFLQRDTKAALASYKSALAVRRRLAQSDPSSALAQRDLSDSLERIGNVQFLQDDAKGALASFQESWGIRDKLAKADPRSATAQRDLLVSCYKLGNLSQQSSDFHRAASWYDQALQVAKAFSRPELFKQQVEALEARLRFTQAAKQALTDLAVIDQQPVNERLALLHAVQRALVQHHERDRAVQAAEKLAGVATKPDEVYDAARAFSLCAPLADMGLARDKLAARAVELLKQAVAKGFKDAVQMKNDPDLAPLWQRDDFQKLLAEFEKNQPEAKP
jgi:tetratricopeptide (TPR) repeat protein